jgi:serine/threonine-protein kinase
MSPGTMRRSTLGNYRLVDFLGAGGMGEVYRGMHQTTGRVAAVKILTATGRSPSMGERFRNEARIQSTLSHPHIVTLYEFFEAEGLPCIAMEYVSGETLDHLLQTYGPLSAGQALTWFAQVVDAVGYVHQRGIVHRDLKTNNIKIDDDGRVKLLDFGIAKAGDSPKLTTDGSVVGTLHYLSPEQVRSSAATPASDIWSLGVVLYEIVTGRVPFASETLTGVMVRILNGTYDPPSRGSTLIPKDIERIIARCLRSEPAQRYANAEALLTDVRAALAPPGAGELPVPAVSLRMRGSGELVAMLRRRGPLVASVSLAAAAFAFLLWSARVCCGPGDVRPERPRDTPTVTPVPGPIGPDKGTGVPAVAGPPAAALRPVIIKVFGEGAADVYRDGVKIGSTPVRFQARIGEWVNLTLKRAGHVDRHERFQVVDGDNEYAYFMSQVGPPSAAALPASTPVEEPAR